MLVRDTENALRLETMSVYPGALSVKFKVLLWALLRIMFCNSLSITY